MTRILHVVRSFDLSGRSRMIGQLCDRLAAQGFRSAVAVLSDAAGYSPAGLDIVRMEGRQGLDLRTGARLRRLARERGCDIIHSHGRGAALYAALAAGWLGRRPLVHTVHRSDGDRLPGNAPVRRWLASRIGCAVAVSDAARRAFVGVNGFPAARTATIYNGVDAAAFGQRAQAEEGDPVIGAVANLSPDKDTETLLRAFLIVLRRQPRATLRIAGDGPAAGDARALCASLGLADRVTFLGFRNDVPQLLPQFSVLAHATRTEGLGMALLEAMAAGVPVVASRVGGIPEIVEDGVTGVLVAPGDPAALAEAVAGLLGDRARRLRLAQAGRARVRAEFSVERMCGKYADVYRRLLSGRS